MDEPSAILDDNEVETLFGVVRRLTAEGVGVVYISHRLDEIPRIGSRVTVLSDGRTVATGLPADTPAGTLVERMVGRRVDQLYPDRPKAGAAGEVLLDVRGLTRVPDVRDVSFQVRAGEIVGIGGLVGAGRTELLRLIYGLDQPDSGEVYVDGERLPSGRPSAAISRRAGSRARGPQVAGAAAELESLQERQPRRPRALRAPRHHQRRAERAAATEQLRALNTVPDDADRIARELSGGNQQKVVLSRWLLHHCRVLVLDEPTRGVDVGAKSEIYRLVADLAAGGLGVVMVSSEMDELLGLATRILVMRDGALVAEVDGAEATELELLHHAVAPVEEPATVPEERA